MNKVLIVVLSMFVIINNSNAEGWTFEADSENYPPINSVFNIRDKWQLGKMGFYQGYTVLPRPNHGFALYKDQVWTFYTPELIRSNLINKSASDSIDMRAISMYKSESDNEGNLWLMANNAIYRYNNSGIYCYYLFKCKNNQYKKPVLISGLNFNGTNMFCRAGFIENSTKGYKSTSKFFKYNRDNNEFVEQFEDDISSTPFISIFDGLIDSSEHIYNTRTISNYFLLLNTSSIKRYYRMHDTIYAFAKEQLIAKCNINSLTGDIKFVEYDSTFYRIERERLSHIDSGIYTRVGYQFTQTDKNDNLYVLTSYYHNAQSLNYDTCEFVQPRLIKYERNGKVSFSSIPMIPGDSVAAVLDESSDFSLDSSGRMAILYRGRGIMHYTPAGAGVDNDYPIPGAWIWNLYPNPAKESARIVFHLSPNVRNEAQITVSDINGAVIKDITSLIEYDPNRQEATIDFSVSDLSNGNYYILISAGKSKKLRRLIVNK